MTRALGRELAPRTHRNEVLRPRVTEWRDDVVDRAVATEPELRRRVTEWEEWAPSAEPGQAFRGVSIR